MNKNPKKIQWYELVFEQLQPLHIGKLNYGVIAETEIFIPGQTMWGALTKNYNLLNKADLSENKDLFPSITCFFPSFDGKNILAPFYKNGMFYLGENIKEDEFRFAFVDTIVSTAIKPLARGALDQSLHEIDFLLPQPKNELPEKKINKETNLKWIGLVGIEEGNNYVYDFFKEEQLKINVGGEIKYGFGLLKLKNFKKIDNQLLAKWNLNDKGELFLKDNISSKKIENVLRNFVQINPAIEIKWKGNIVPIAEFDFMNNIPKIKETSFYINVGSSICIKKENNSKLSNYILSKGKFKNITAPIS